MDKKTLAFEPINSGRIFVLPRYSSNGPSSRVRFYQYFPILRAAGFQLEIHPFFDEGYIETLFQGSSHSILSILRAYARRFAALLSIQPGDIVWLQYEFLPWLPDALADIFMRRTASLVIDFDDAIFHRYDQHKLALVRNLLGSKIDRMMRASSLVVAGSTYLAEKAKRAGAPRVELIPSVVDLEKYPLRAVHDQPLCRIGWIGTPVTAPNLRLLGPALSALAHRDFKFALIGAAPPDGIPLGKVENWTWDIYQENNMLSQLDIGVMPLVDKPFERGKCAFKIIQYMASGLPVVASPVGVNREIIRDGENGFLAQTDEEWVRSLIYLMDHPAERAKMGARGRELVESHNSLQVTAPRLVEIFRSLQPCER